MRALGSSWETAASISSTCSWLLLPHPWKVDPPWVPVQDQGILCLGEAPFPTVLPLTSLCDLSTLFLSSTSNGNISQS